jgi:hypothetical protein
MVISFYLEREINAIIGFLFGPVGCYPAWQSQTHSSESECFRLGSLGPGSLWAQFGVIPATIAWCAKAAGRTAAASSFSGDVPRIMRLQYKLSSRKWLLF